MEVKKNGKRRLNTKIAEQDAELLRNQKNNDNRRGKNNRAAEAEGECNNRASANTSKKKKEICSKEKVVTAEVSHDGKPIRSKNDISSRGFNPGREQGNKIANTNITKNNSSGGGLRPESTKGSKGLITGKEETLHGSQKESSKESTQKESSKEESNKEERQPVLTEAVRIECVYDKLVSVDELVPNPNNPNRHPPHQIMMLAKIIKAQGFRRPIVVSNRSGFIIVGHGRYEAAQYLGMPKVPVDYQDYATEAEEWADMLADNRIAEMAERDNDELKIVLDKLRKELPDIELTGYSEGDIERLFSEFNFEPIEDLPDGGDSDADIMAAKIVIKIKDPSLLDEVRSELERFIYDHWTSKQITIVDR